MTIHHRWHRAAPALALLATLAVGAAPVLAAPPTAATIDRSGWRDLLREADDLMARGAWAAAESALREALAIRPDDPQLAYNLAICAFRDGRFAEAAALFEEAAIAGDAEVSRRAVFNAGNALFREAQRIRSSGDAAADPAAAAREDHLDLAIALAARSLASFRDAIDAAPSDRDARANAELAQRLLRELQRERDSRQQEQQQEQEQEQQQDGTAGEQQSPDDSQQNGTPGEQQSPDDSQQDGTPGEPQSLDDSQQDGTPSEPQSLDDSQQDGTPSEQQSPAAPPSGPPQPTPAADTGAPSNDASSPPAAPDGDRGEGDDSEVPEGALEAASEPAPGEPAESAAPPGRLSREQADRLLQMIRDREQQRRAAIAQQRERERRRIPVPMDW